jgi:hypothetical protein
MARDCQVGSASGLVFTIECGEPSNEQINGLLLETPDCAVRFFRVYSLGAIERRHAGT